MRNQIFSAIKVSTLALGLSFGLSFVYAWTAPTVTAPNGNVSAPINTSSTAQAKAGAFTVGSLITAGSATVGSLSAGAGSISTTGALTSGPATVTSLNAGSGNISTAGSLASGPATVGSLDAGAGNIFGYNLFAANLLTVTGTTTTNGLKVVNGAGANKVLTSDASGNAGWRNPAGRGMPLIPAIYWSTTAVNFTSGTYDVLGCGGSGGYGYTVYTTARSIGGCVTLIGTTLSGSTNITVGTAGIDWVWGVIGTGGGASFIGSTRLGGGGGSGGYCAPGGNGNGTYGGAAGAGCIGWGGNVGAGGAPNGATTVLSYTNAQFFVPSFGASTSGVVVIWGPY